MKPTFHNWFLAATICLSLGQAANAASVYWDTNSTTAGSGAATGTWGTSLFWTTNEPGTAGTTGTLPTANDDVFIAAATNGTTGTITISGAQVAGSVTIQEPAANPGVTISGGTSLTLGGGSSASKGLFVTGNGTHTVSTPLILSGANTIQNAGTGTFTVSGGITGTGNLTLNNNSTGGTGINLSTAAVNNTGTISTAGTSSGFVILGNANATPGTGSGGLGANVTSFSQNSTTAPLEFRNANNSAYAGNYDINAGTLHWGGTNTSGTVTATNSASVINIGATSGTAAATLNIINNAVSGKLNNNITVRAGSTGTKTIGVALTGSGVTFSTTGTITLDDNVTLSPNTSSVLNPNGSISNGSNGAKGVTKAGAGTVNFSMAHGYTGATSVTAGTLALTGASGTLASTSGVAISGGTLQLNNTSAANNGNRIPDSTVVTMTGGTLDFKNDAAAATAFSETIAVTASAAGTITASQAAADGSSALTIGSFTRNPGTTLAFSGTGLGVDVRNQILFTTPPATIGGIIPWATYANTGFAGYDGTNGIVAITAADIDAQGSTIADDSTSNLRIFADGTGSAIALGAATTSINSLVQANTVVAPPTIDTAAKTLRVNSVLLSSAANTKGLTIGSAANDGTLTAGTAGGELLLINSSASALTLNAVIANNTSASSVTKAGTGDATFAGNNTYSGGTNLVGGVVTATHANAFGTGTVTITVPTKRLAVGNGITISNPIVFNGGGEALRGVFENSAASGNATLAGPITISGTLAGGGHFASTGTDGTLTITGPITSTSSSPVVRAGTVIMSGVGTASNYTSFNASAGVTRLGASDALLPTATLEMGSSGDSRFDLNGFNQTLAGITRAGNNTFIGNASSTGNSTLTTTGTSTYSGSILNVLAPGDKKTFLVVDSGALTLSGAFSAETATINNGGTLNINTNGGDSFNPAGRLVTVNNGGVLKYLAANKVQNDTVIDVKSGGTFDENGQTDVIGYISGAGSITNLNGALTLNMPSVGSGSDFSGTITGSATLSFTAAGIGASSSSTQILSGSNAMNGVSVVGGRLIGRNTAAFGVSGKTITVGASGLTLDPTIEFGTDTPMNDYVINMSSGITGTIELNRATSGAAFTQTASIPTLGNSLLNIERGANVATGTPVLQFPSISLAAGVTGLGAVTLNPIGVDISVTGGVTRPGANAGNLRLGGTSTGNIISGDIQDNGTNKLNVTKQNSSTWTFAGINSYTGTTTVNEGVLHLTGSLAAGSAVTVGGATATGTPTLTGAGGTVNGSLNIAAAGGGAAGTVNPGTVGTVGTLNAAATTIAGTYACDVSGASSDLLAVTGNLDITGATLAVSGTLTAPSYTIATYTGSLAGSFTVSPALPAGYTLDTTTTGQIKIVSSGTDYDAWMALYPSITVPADKLPTADPDGDGLTNEVEYAFGLAPNSGTSVNPILVQLDKTAGTFTYQRRSSTGMTYTILKSTDLVTWTPATATQTPGTPDVNNVQTVSVTLTGAPLTADKLFVRVKAE